MARAQTDVRVQGSVGTKRAPAIGAGAEQHRLPERGDPRDVCLDIELGDVDENPADDRVNERAAVESPNQPLAVAAVLDVADAGTHR